MFWRKYTNKYYYFVTYIATDNSSGCMEMITNFKITRFTEIEKIHEEICRTRGFTNVTVVLTSPPWLMRVDKVRAN
jgi:hypothetical protein